MLVKRQRFKWIAFRLGAIALSLSPLIAFEVVLRVIDWQEPHDHLEIVDPFVGFSEVRPLFELSDDGTKYEVAPNRYPLFRPASFSANKAENGFRIFCLGGSTVQGRPFSTETSFTKWLELSLNSANPKIQWEVVNCGGVSYASYRLTPILEEILDYDPDLVIVYTGHNEFLEDRTYESIKSISPWVSQSHERLSNFRTYRFIRSRFVSAPNPIEKPDPPTSSLPTEAEARLDFRGGLELYHRDDEWQNSVIQHYELNLRNIVRLCQRSKTDLIFANPVSNLSGTAPFKSEFGDGLDTLARRRCIEIWEELNDRETVNAESEIVSLLELIQIDNRFAAAHFRLGQAYNSLRKFESARQHFLLAKDNDICPLRMLESMHGVLQQVARKTETPMIDIRGKFEANAPNGIPGDESLLDHVHPTIAGHQKIAQWIMEELIRRSFVVAREDWQSIRDEAFNQHLESLSFMYFQRGKDRLRGLKRWSAGEVTREKGEPLNPID